MSVQYLLRGLALFLLATPLVSADQHLLYVASPGTRNYVECGGVGILVFDIDNGKRHGCPSHGIALTPDEKQLWIADCANSAIHVFRLHGHAAQTDRQHSPA